MLRIIPLLQTLHTPDISQKEQMSVVMHYNNIKKADSGDNVEIKESFLGFVINIMTVKKMIKEILNFLTGNGLPTENLHG